MGPVIIALDFRDANETLTFLDQFKQQSDLFVKVGMELFYFEGPAILRELKRRGIRVFLDLKLYDIPNTVEQAMFQLGQQGVDMVTVHAAGGAEMMRRARIGLDQGSQIAGVSAAKLLAITQLTSTSEQQMQSEQLVSVPLAKAVTHLAQLADASGADGVVSSALEDRQIHAATRDEFLCINPGIRLATDVADDQKRVVTPSDARRLGSNGLVVGRTITQAPDPIAAYQTVLQEWRMTK
ncbi:orotidine-5'-phosphate decarboxylase [Secundilactobacillus kimchicus]|uniref:Orotidine 5'-phosphate decarboxylase n=1 Tax=Secundilactobacillus kimchicus JCM 15530 TaxID=1302272 RepID=A0A0R1HPL9_9LACO|nr:orotidine-5'-phosphate decarboxylase [Secundilactobacillus kimchicus]KRK48773.1 orotidine-5-phosphate decarboxylase [Secundilactobacillus kimchicus JCM 15530]MBT9672018.1 orotidine-5'-phosphate decarboxylase [Secundilactobacillus kimchicus]